RLDLIAGERARDVDTGYLAHEARVQPTDADRHDSSPSQPYLCSTLAARRRAGSGNRHFTRTFENVFSTHPNAPPARSAAIRSGVISRTSVSTRSVSAPNAGAGPVLRPKLACQGNAGNTPLPCRSQNPRALRCGLFTRSIERA